MLNFKKTISFALVTAFCNFAFAESYDCNFEYAIPGILVKDKGTADINIAISEVANSENSIKINLDTGIHFKLNRKQGEKSEIEFKNIDLQNVVCSGSANEFAGGREYRCNLPIGSETLTLAMYSLKGENGNHVIKIGHRDQVSSLVGTCSVSADVK